MPKPVKGRSLTGLVTEAGQVGVVRGRVPEEGAEIPGQDRTLQAGDPDVSALEAGTVGESAPGGSTPTPDQSDVDAIGRAMGIAGEDGGELRPVAEILQKRDRRRARSEPAGEE
jgi:Family of unknown function (DUF6335)